MVGKILLHRETIHTTCDTTRTWLNTVVLQWLTKQGFYKTILAIPRYFEFLTTVPGTFLAFWHIGPPVLAAFRFLTALNHTTFNIRCRFWFRFCCRFVRSFISCRRIICINMCFVLIYIYSGRQLKA